MHIEAYLVKFSNGSYENINFLFYFNLTCFPAKFRKKCVFLDYNI